MRTITGLVLVQESNRGIAGLTVTAYAHTNQSRVRVGSVATGEDGRFSLEYKSTDEKFVWNLQLEVSVDGQEPHVLYADTKPRMAAGQRESWTIRVPLAGVVAAGVLGAQKPSVAATQLPALGTVLARTAADTSYESEIQKVVRDRLDSLRESSAATATAFHMIYSDVKEVTLKEPHVFTFEP